MEIRGRVLVIAGSDSGGGAGIQADLKTIAACGAFATTAVTAVTVQNTQGVFAVHDVPTEIITDQMRVVLEDIGTDVIKTGMLHTSAVIRRMLTVLDRLASQAPLVVDPVMVAKGGARLLNRTAEDVVRETLLPRAFLITPNIPEAEVLLGREIPDREHMEEAANDLMALGPKNVLLKGGHLTGDDGITDVLATARETTRYTSARIDTANTHGTGCTLASAVAALIARGHRLEKAVPLARDYVHAAIVNGPSIGQGHGPLNHMHGCTAPEDWPAPSPVKAVNG
ncbi:MAG: bifunctional hydroxymethylpyrimidine kinase/phosphomethylpyrimidine kinase [Alphaproteobacteria bacterium]